MEIKYVSATAALQLVKSGDRVFIHGSAATPLHLVNTLLSRADEISGVELVAISTYGDIHWNKPKVLKSFYLNSLFVSPNVRDWVNGSDGDYIPVFLSEIPRLFENNILPLDVALLQVSVPDKNGYCTLGTSVDTALAALRCAKKVIAQVNPRMPLVHGDGLVPVSRFDAMVWYDEALPELSPDLEHDPVAVRVAAHVAELVEDGATLQLGIGSIPGAVLHALSNHKDLGIHTEMFSDGIMPLIERGVITNARKTINKGKVVSSFILGSRKLYDFIDDNHLISCMDVAYVNNAHIISKNPRVTAINSAIEVDITGQVCADSIGTLQYSGIGGQMDFMQGASMSVGGKPIIALPSTTRDGISRIVPFLRQGAGVVTTRGHVHYIVTEYGAVNLYGKNLEQRARLLTSIAHPAHREMLERACHERFS